LLCGNASNARFTKCKNYFLASSPFTPKKTWELRSPK